ncbi:MAG: hypothetical protein RL425_1355 [Pseudomonadota bacterium]
MWLVCAAERLLMTALSRIILLIRNDPSNAPACLLNVAFAPWDQVHVTMEDGLPGIRPSVDSDIKGRN